MLALSATQQTWAAESTVVRPMLAGCIQKLDCFRFGPSFLVVTYGHTHQPGLGGCQGDLDKIDSTHRVEWKWGAISLYTSFTKWSSSRWQAASEST